MRGASYIAGVVCLLISIPALAAALPSGEWVRGDGGVRARISRCGVKICATTTWTRDSAGPEKAGDRFIMAVKAAEPGHWMGSAFDPQRKLSYNVDVRLQGDRLTTRGCISGSTACLVTDWVRKK
jgi:uncharacterized protein (DUF2147 family)